MDIASGKAWVDSTLHEYIMTRYDKEDKESLHRKGEVAKKAAKALVELTQALKEDFEGIVKSAGLLKEGE